MICDNTNGALDLAIKHNAAKNGNLLKKLDQLNMDKCVVMLYTDFAPLSFAFSVLSKTDFSLVYNGGLIYHGIHDAGGNGSAPTFSVSLTPVNGWSIHT